MSHSVEYRGEEKCAKKTSLGSDWARQDVERRKGEGLKKRTYETEEG